MLSLVKKGLWDTRMRDDGIVGNWTNSLQGWRRPGRLSPRLFGNLGVCGGKLTEGYR